MTLLTGPVIFKVSTSRKVAGDFNGLLLNNLNRIKYACLCVAAIALIIRYVQWDVGEGDAIGRLVLLGAMASAALVSGLIVSPLTKRARAHVDGPNAFKRLHGMAMILFLLEIAAGVAIWFFN